MRELKFRVWNTIFEEYVRPDYNIIGYVYPLDGTLGVNNLDDCVIEQYTGLHDKNGKEIYEGDIVSVHNKNNKKEYNIGVVEFRKGAFRCPFFLGKYQSGQVEVIGNIHENADLLGDKK